MKEANIITLTTDFGAGDYSVAALKGALYQLIPEVTIVDISHQVDCYSIGDAAYLLQGAYTYFPQGTIHIIGVDNELSEQKPLLLLVYQGQYFIVADNGFISLFTYNQANVQVYRILLEHTHSILPTLDFSTKVAQQLCQGIAPEAIGIPYKAHLFVSLFTPKVRPHRIEGSVIYIDSFGNAVSNITETLLKEEARGRRFNVVFRYQSTKNTSVENIPNQYSHAEGLYSDGVPFLLFNRLKYLEMAISKAIPNSFGGSNSLLGIRKGDTVNIDFI